jgi:hypothetical protein
MSITIRQVEEHDFKVIEELNKLQIDFRLTNLENCIIDRIVFDGNVPVAYGIVKKLAEAIMLINPRCSRVTRAKAMRELMHYAESGAKKEGCEQLHCFVSDAKLARTLERQFRFVQSSDIVLVKNI